MLAVNFGDTAVTDYFAPSGRHQRMADLLLEVTICDDLDRKILENFG